MELNRNTKHQVKAGDLLRFDSGEEYRVETVIGGTDRYMSGSSLSFTIRDTRDGFVIYCYPSSKLYGAEIVKRQ